MKVELSERANRHGVSSVLLDSPDEAWARFRERVDRRQGGDEVREDGGDVRLARKGHVDLGQVEGARRRRYGHHAAREPRCRFDRGLASKVIRTRAPVACANRFKVERLGLAPPLSRRATVD